jgi:hypothetical protein
VRFPPSGTAARSRNSPQSTQWLSIQCEGGCHLTARGRGVSGSSFLPTCHWGGCSEIIMTFRGYVGGHASRGPALHPYHFERRKPEGTWPVLSPSLVFCRSEHRYPQRAVKSNGRSTWPQVPIKTPDCWRAQHRARVLAAPRGGSVTQRGIAFERIQLGVRVACGQGSNQLRARAIVRRSASNTVLFLSMK